LAVPPASLIWRRPCGLIIRPVAGLPLLHVDHAELDGGKQVVKGLFDKVCAAAALLALAPLFGAIALAITVTDRGPVFFRQTRIGKDGRTFTVYKFRTMVVDAEQHKVLLTSRNEAAGLLFKIRRDPRVTRPVLQSGFVIFPVSCVGHVGAAWSCAW
jgi:lipopolysaccharide/colanic/teichoic acid biosynthesis glycosyltransferase